MCTQIDNISCSVIPLQCISMIRQKMNSKNKSFVNFVESDRDVVVCYVWPLCNCQTCPLSGTFTLHPIVNMPLHHTCLPGTDFSFWEKSKFYCKNSIAQSIDDFMNSRVCIFTNTTLWSSIFFSVSQFKIKNSKHTLACLFAGEKKDKKWTNLFKIYRFSIFTPKWQTWQKPKMSDYKMTAIQPTIYQR